MNFIIRVTISFVLITGILFAANREAVTRYITYLVGALYAMFITFEAPLSSVSMNPARTFGSAFRARWQAFWIYLIVPTLGMLAGAEIFSFQGDMKMNEWKLAISRQAQVVLAGAEETLP